MTINYDNIFYTLIGGDTFFINKKLLASLGIELSCLLTYLIEKKQNNVEKDEITEDGYFSVTDTDICIYTGIDSVKLAKIKKRGINKELIFIKKMEGSEKVFYKPNYEKIFDIMMSEKSISELSYERIFKESNENEHTFTKEGLENLSFRDLRMLCKKLNITFNGNNRKEELIDKILRHQENFNLKIAF